MIKELQKLADEIEIICAKRGWSRVWNEGGCYLFLESAEFIEALRGKGKSTPTEEGADVLFVLLSLLAANNVPIADVIKQLKVDLAELEIKPRYDGEHTSKK